MFADVEVCFLRSKFVCAWDHCNIVNFTNIDIQFKNGIKLVNMNGVCFVFGISPDVNNFFPRLFWFFWWIDILRINISEVILEFTENKFLSHCWAIKAIQIAPILSTISAILFLRLLLPSLFLGFCFWFETRNREIHCITLTLCELLDVILWWLIWPVSHFNAILSALTRMTVSRNRHHQTYLSWRYLKWIPPRSLQNWSFVPLRQEYLFY